MSRRTASRRTALADVQTSRRQDASGHGCPGGLRFGHGCPGADSFQADSFLGTWMSRRPSFPGVHLPGVHLPRNMDVQADRPWMSRRTVQADCVPGHGCPGGPCGTWMSRRTVPGHGCPGGPCPGGPCGCPGGPCGCPGGLRSRRTAPNGLRLGGCPDVQADRVQADRGGYQRSGIDQQRPTGAAPHAAVGIHWPVAPLRRLRRQANHPSRLPRPGTAPAHSQCCHSWGQCATERVRARASAPARSLCRNGLATKVTPLASSRSAILASLL